MNAYKKIRISTATICLLVVLFSLSCNLLFPEPETPESIAPVTVPVATSILPTPGLPLTEVLPLPTSTQTTAFQPQGKVYYVAPEGDDANPGSEDLPWRTIQKAAETLTAGETVYIRGGIYHERVVPQNSGNAQGYITYAAYPEETPIIDGEGVSLPDDLAGLVEIAGQSYLRIHGLKVVNAGPHLDNAGILAIGSQHILIENNTTYNTVSSGIGVWESQDVVIDGNEVILACNDGRQENITVASTDTFEIKNNHVHDGGPGNNGGEGIDAKDGSSNGKIHHNHVHHNKRLGIYVDAWDKHTFNIEIFSNLVHDTENDGFTLASEMGGLLENISLYNNIAYNNKFIGINISANGDSAVHPMRNIRVINNTLYQNGIGEWGGGMAVSIPDISGLILRNNLISQNLSFQLVIEAFVPQENLQVDHNLIDGFRDYESETYGESYFSGDPLFINPNAVDFHLRAGSPAIDSGSPDGAPAEDFDGNPRPSGAGVDIGAYER